MLSPLGIEVKGLDKVSLCVFGGGGGDIFGNDNVFCYFIWFRFLYDSLILRNDHVSRIAMFLGLPF